jgi:hypothetical protein
LGELMDTAWAVHARTHHTAAESREQRAEHNMVSIGGCGLAAACDLSVMSNTAKLGFTEVLLPLLPCLPLLPLLPLSCNPICHG